jgi:uracil-DNA glycosylase
MHSQNNQLSGMEIAALLNAWWAQNGVEVFDLPKVAQKPNKPTNSVTPSIIRPAAQSIINPNNVVEEAIKLANDAQNLEQLRNNINSFENFHLAKTATQMVFCDGNENADIMIIGEAPSIEDDETGKSFSGQDGKLLDKMFASIGLERDKNIYLTHIINWRPPGDRAPSKEEIAISLPFIRRHIELKKPKQIILLGQNCTNAIIGAKNGTAKLRNSMLVTNIKTDGIEQKIPSFYLQSPNNLIRRPSDKSDAWRDLLRIKKIIAQS